MKFTIDTTKKSITPESDVMLKDVVKELLTLLEKGVGEYTLVYPAQTQSTLCNKGTSGYVVTDTLTKNEGIIPPLHY
jgi:hypothetical protein